MALDPEKNFDPITGEFKYAPQWQGPLSGRSFEQQTEDAINYLRGLIDAISGGATPSDAYPKAPGTASPGIMANYSRGDHVHPLQTSVSGAAGSAGRWTNARELELTGAVSGSAYLDGSGDVQLETSIPNATTTSAGLMSAADKIALDSFDPSGLVHIAGAETITGPKDFTQGPYGAGNTVASSTIDLSQGVVFTKTISANTTFTITGVPSGKAATFNLVLTNAGSYTITWPSNVEWGDDTPPDLTPIGLDVLTFMTPDGGVHWYGVVALSGLPDATGQTAYVRANDLITRAQIDSLFSEGA